MPELPDITIYLEALQRFVVHRPIDRITVRSLFVVRTFEPEISECEGKVITGLRRLGKRVVFELETDLFLVFHLMIAGRFHWKKPGAGPTRRVDLPAFGFEHGTLMLTEASQKKRASIHVIRGEAGLIEHQRSGIDVLSCSLEEFALALTRENHTVKRSLTDPTLFSGIGNAYSDEILHAARMSPAKLTSKLLEEEIARLHAAVQSTLTEWIDRLRLETGDRFPEKVTAIHPQMAVHGRFQLPCPVCGSPVQRIVYATRETNYCATCQNGGRVLKDRSLSRLLKDDWPGKL